MSSICSWRHAASTLTTADAALMAGLDRQVCQVLLRNLIETGFLEQRPGGKFARLVASNQVARNRAHAGRCEPVR